jgi:hypothetical protein
MKDENSKTLSLIKNIKSDLKKYRSQFEQNWKNEEDAYYGSIWKNDSTGRKPYENFVFPIVEAETAMLTDGMPSGVIASSNPQSKGLVAVINKSIEQVLNDQDYSGKLEMAVRKSVISAPSYIHWYYDHNANDGEGRIMGERLDWRQVYLSGETQNIEDLFKVRLELKRTKDWLKINYKNFAEDLEKEETSWDDHSDYKEGFETKDLGGKSGRKKPTPYYDKDILKLVKTYVRDYSKVKIPEEQTQEELLEEMKSLQNGEAPDVEVDQDHKAHIENHFQKVNELLQQFGLSAEMPEEIIEQFFSQSEELIPVYAQYKLLMSHIDVHNTLIKENPNGETLKYKKAIRCIESVNNIILYDGESKDDHATIPLVAYYCYRDDGPYGFSEVRNLLDSQKLASEMLYKEYKGLKKVANPAIKVDKSTGLTKDDITNEDGEIYIIEDGDINYMQPGQTSPQITAFVDRRKQSINEISGINEVSQGKTMHPNQSGFSIEKLQQQALGRIRLKERNIERHSTKRTIFLVASLILQYYPYDKLLQINEKEFPNEEIIFSEFDLSNLEFEAQINESSLIGVDSSALNALYMSFVQQQAITFDEFLELAQRLPNKEKIKEMVQARNDKDAQLAEMQNQLLLLKGTYQPEQLTKDELNQFQQLQQSGAMNA